MIFLKHILAGSTLLCSLPIDSFSQQLDPLIVTGSNPTPQWGATQHLVSPACLRTPDAAAALYSIPGAAVVRNGPQTGIVQLRGLSGDRVKVRVDGMTITPACPNHMDPPLHYASLSEGSLVHVIVGVSPVSAGGDQIGGTVSVSRPNPRFSDDKSALLGGKLGAAFLGSQNASLVSSDINYAAGDAALGYRGSAATANDLRFPGGRVKDSGYEMTRHDLAGAWRTANGFIELDAGYSVTRDAGTPALPMDMVKDDAFQFGLRQKEGLNWGTLENRVYVHDIDHLMDNFSNRPAPMGMAMEAPSSSRDYGWRGDGVIPRGDTTLRVGIDLHRNEFNAEQVAISNGFRRDTFHDNERSRYGTYIELEQQWTDQWSTQVGLRGDLVSSDADAVKNQIMPMGMILTDQKVFNSADRSITDEHVDVVAALRFAPDETTSCELAFGVKSRAPSLVERYLWTPLNASAGLADGRTYLGNMSLDSETSYQIALTVEKTGDDWDAKFAPFYQRVSDFIQGMPIARNDASGNPVLQYQNLDEVELYGCEIAGNRQITDEFSVGASASYVRGRNRDSGDDLYRLAPLRGLMDLTYRKDQWEAHLECVWADSQNHVSQVQGEPSSPGYGLLNLRVARVFAKTLRVEVGLENLLDKRYADHLGGVNRVNGGDLAVGERIPNAGRFAYTSIHWQF